MNYRPYETNDLDRVKAILAMQPFELEVPPLEDPRYVSRVAVTNGNGSPVAFGFVRVVGEAYLVLDPRWGTPAWRWEALQMAHGRALSECVAKGLNRAVTWVPSEIVRSYGKRLRSLGWAAQDRQSFVFEVPNG